MSRFTFLGFLVLMIILVTISDSSSQENDSYVPPPKLPAYKTPSEKTKTGFRLYDYRSANIDLYKITKAPSVGVRAVAEFEPVSILLLEYFPGYYDTVYQEMITAVIDRVKIYFFYNTSSMKNTIISKMKGWGISQTQIDNNCVFVNTEVDSVWTRDSGPNPIVSADNKYGIIDFRYYPDRYYDDKIPTELGLLLNLNIFRPSMDFEGGNFMTNGKGLCMATKGSIWENLPMTDYDIKKIFKDYLGCEKTVFLKPLSGEGTTHIDMFAKFTSEDTILLGQYKYSQDCINYDILEENYATLLNTTTVDGKPLKIVRIPMPDNSDGVWRTYTNSLLINNLALVPVYSRHNIYEVEALNAYKTALGSGWTIVPIDSEDIIPDGGAIHCITMTVPDFELVKFQTDPESLCGNSTNCETEGCGNITTKGYCDGDIVFWCENGNPYYYDCSSPCNMVPNGYPCEQKCEYDNSKGYYDCISKYICTQCVDECQMGEMGCFDSTTAWMCAGDTDNDGCNEIEKSSCQNNQICNNGQCQSSCVPDCTNKECGDDGCGSICGECKQNEYCGQDSKCHIVSQDASIDIQEDIQDNGNLPDTHNEDIVSMDILQDSTTLQDSSIDISSEDIKINDIITYDAGDAANIDVNYSDTPNYDAITDISTVDTKVLDAHIDIGIETDANEENLAPDNSSGCTCAFVE